MSHTPNSQRQFQRLTPTQIQTHHQGPEDLIGRINTMSIGTPHPIDSTTSPAPIRGPTHAQVHAQSPPSQQYNLHNHNLQSAPSPYGHHDFGNHGHSAYWPQAQAGVGAGTATSASAPGGGGVMGLSGGVGGGGGNVPFTSTDNSPVTATFPYIPLDGQQDHGNGRGYEGYGFGGQGQGQGRMGSTPGQGGGGYGGIAPAPSARNRDGDGLENGYNSRGHQVHHSHGGYSQHGQGHDGLESVPGSPMSMSSGMLGQYYAYGGDQSFYMPQQGYTPLRNGNVNGRGKQNRDGHQNANGNGIGRQTNRQSYRDNRSDYSSHLSMRSLMSPISSHQPMPMGYHNQHLAQGAMPIHYGLHPNYQPGVWRGGMNAYNRRENHTPRSRLLDEFRMNKSRRWHLADIQGHMVEFCGDQHGSRFIQQRLESGNEEDRALALGEIEPNIFALMMDVFGNYVIQKLFEVCDQSQKARLASKMEGNVVKLSLEMYGCRVVQKAFEHVLKDQKDKLVDELKGRVIDCVKDNNGNHVIQRLITLDGCPDFIPQSFATHVGELACHPYGCRVLQKTFECLEASQTRQLLEEMHQEIMRFTNDSFGNYVVQSMITSTTEEDRFRVLAAFDGHLQIMARHKFASNVIEKALQSGDPAQRQSMIQELIGEQADGTNQIAKLLKDAYGNFPVQTALEVAEKPQYEKLLEIITSCLPQLKHTPVGKRLEMKIAEIKRGPIIAQGGLVHHELPAFPGTGTGTPADQDDSVIPPPLSRSSSPSISLSDAFSGNDTSFTEETGLTSPDQQLGASSSTSKSKGSGEGVAKRQSSSRSSRRRRGEGEGEGEGEEEIEDLLQ